MRMLDNVIDINYYAVKKARDSNLRHRPVGLGIMGFQDCLHQLRTPYASQELRSKFADRRWKPSATTPTTRRPNWPPSAAATRATRARCGTSGILPQDSLDLLAEARGGYVEVDSLETLDWDALRARIAQHGMRNSNCVAIAPTATISNIIGVSPRSSRPSATCR
jgi:ribonucleoside-diphosphate reductase alpha chain